MDHEKRLIATDTPIGQQRSVALWEFLGMGFPRMSYCTASALLSHTVSHEPQEIAVYEFRSAVQLGLYFVEAGQDLR
jgi:hypothetical protein